VTFREQVLKALMGFDTFRQQADAIVALHEEAVEEWRKALEKTDARLRRFCCNSRPKCADCDGDAALPCEDLDKNTALLSADKPGKE
jgi:hypothetical protein